MDRQALVEEWVTVKKAQADILRAVPPGKARILAFATFIEQMPMAYPLYDQAPPLWGFSIHTWGVRDDWATPACIGGWTERIWWPSDHHYVPHSAALSALTGTEEGPWRALFFGDGFRLVPRYVTPLAAARVLRHFAETGVVDWNITR